MKKTHLRYASHTLSVITLLAIAGNVSAQTALPTCSSDAVDSDGDGYGWENNASCLVRAADEQNTLYSSLVLTR